MEAFTVGKIQDFMRTVYCMDFERFEAMYKAIGFRGAFYIQEKYNAKNQNFFTWFCELTPDCIEKMINFIDNN